MHFKKFSPNQGSRVSYFATVKNGAIMGQKVILPYQGVQSVQNEFLNQFDQLRVSHARDWFYWLGG